MLNAVLILLLRLILDCDANLDLGNPGFFSDRYFDLFLFLSYLSEKWVNSALKMIRDVAGSKGELILYFKSKFWAWVGKLRTDSVHRFVFYSLRPLSKLRRALLKLFTLGGNLFKLSLATYSVRFINESWEFVYDSCNQKVHSLLSDFLRNPYFNSNSILLS